MSNRSRRSRRPASSADRPASPPAPPSGRRARYVIPAALLAVAVVAGLFAWSRGSRPPAPDHPVTAAPGPASAATPAAAATFVEDAACADCHAEQYGAWTKSHHALAMQEANAQTVRGDFADTRFGANGVTTRFFRAGDAYVVNTDGPDGKPRDYPVKYVFGYAPLQQYLLELPGGRLQALSVAWDTQQRRWFHLYPDEKIDHRDELHWTKISQNWNFMCAECHSTDLKKNYDPEHDTYATTYREISVGCQGCHGPASRHVEWARARPAADAGGTPDRARTGLQVNLSAADNRVQIEACARCHARRSVIAPDYAYGRRLMDTHQPALLEESLYYADGQIRAETYEYGSFMQSKMAARGVRCSDCHDPHTAGLRKQGNALCTRCHTAEDTELRPGIDGRDLQKKDYDSRAHHQHAPGTPGSRCIECHAPETTYMVVDPRADHSFRIPRPDLTEKTGAPNACNRCHRDKSPQWAAEILKRSHPQSNPQPHYGEALAAGREGRAGAAPLLAALAGDPDQPAIVRASALDLLQRYPGAIAAQMSIRGLRDADPLVRRAAVDGFWPLPPEQRVEWLGPALTDPVRAVRQEAARLLAPASAAEMNPAVRRDFDFALAELEAGYRSNLDRAEGRVNYANLNADLGRPDKAERLYRSALAAEHVPVVAIVNFADFYRAASREDDAERVLRDGLARYPGNPDISRALALSLIRQQRKDEALALLQRAYAANRKNMELAYIYALALDDAGRHGPALKILEAALPDARGNRDILVALASFHARAGDAGKAAAYMQQLAAINPADPALPQQDAPDRR